MTGNTKPKSNVHFFTNPSPGFNHAYYLLGFQTLLSRGEIASLTVGDRYVAASRRVAHLLRLCAYLATSKLHIAGRSASSLLRRRGIPRVLGYCETLQLRANAVPRWLSAEVEHGTYGNLTRQVLDHPEFGHHYGMNAAAAFAFGFLVISNADRDIVICLDQCDHFDFLPPSILSEVDLYFKGQYHRQFLAGESPVLPDGFGHSEERLHYSLGLRAVAQRQGLLNKVRPLSGYMILSSSWDMSRNRYYLEQARRLRKWTPSVPVGGQMTLWANRQHRLKLFAELDRLGCPYVGGLVVGERDAQSLAELGVRREWVAQFVPFDEYLRLCASARAWAVPIGKNLCTTPKITDALATGRMVIADDPLTEYYHPLQASVHYLSAGDDWARLPDAVEQVRSMSPAAYRDMSRRIADEFETYYAPEPAARYILEEAEKLL